MSGWKFGDLHITVRQRLCEALYAAGRKDNASESLLDLVNTFHEEVNASVPFTKWVSGELMCCSVRFYAFQTCLQALPSSVSPQSKTTMTLSRTRLPFHS